MQTETPQIDDLVERFARWDLSGLVNYRGIPPDPSKGPTNTLRPPRSVLPPRG